MDTISNRIKKALDLRNMKQIDLVDKTGIGKSSISTYISGEYEPKQKNIYKIAKALDVSESWLMGNDVPMERTHNSEVPDFPPDVRAAARNMMELSEEDRKSAIDMINFLSKRGREAKNN